jgi:HEAT repeat protein
LGESRDARAVEPLVAALTDEDCDVRKVAAAALGKIGWEPQNDTQRALRTIALSKWEEATSLGAAAVEPLIVALKDRYVSVREKAAEALGKIGDARAVEPLIVALADRYIGDEQSIVSLREKAAEALGRIGNAAVELLIVALKVSDSDVRREAVEALKKIDPNRLKEEVAKKEVKAQYERHPCDICGRQLTTQLSRRVITAYMFKRIVENGFNPFRGDIRLPTGLPLSELGALAGLSAQQQYTLWRPKALASDTDWVLCEGCAWAACQHI